MTKQERELLVDLMWQNVKVVTSGNVEEHKGKSYVDIRLVEKFLNRYKTK